MSNGLRTDPTRTTLLRRKFEAKLVARIRALIKIVRSTVGDEDRFALNTKKVKPFTSSGFTFNAYTFGTDEEKLKEFSRWLDIQIKRGVLSIPDDGADPERPWMSEYVDSAYRRGLVNAYIQVNAPSDPTSAYDAGRQAEFIRSAFTGSERLSKVRFLATRTYNDLKGVSDYMGQRMNRVMADAIANGYGADKTARELAKVMEGIPTNRVRQIARTEIIAAHAQGQLDSYKALGVEELGLMAEWITAGDDRVCPQCAAMLGRVFTVDEAQGLIPLHPGCRCSWIPRTGTKYEKMLRTKAPE